MVAPRRHRLDSLCRFACMLALVQLGVAGTVFAQQKPLSDGHLPGRNPFDDKFGAFVKDTLDEWHVPGLSIAVIDHDQVFAEGYGIATFPDTPATPETIWYGASTTKAYVAAAMAAVIDSKNYSQLARGWSTPVSSIIRDDFVLQDEWATAHVTLEDAVSHRTGLGSLHFSSLRVENGVQVTPRDVVRRLRHLPLFAEPRTTYAYSNSMYVALGYVLERLTSSPLAKVLGNLIWEPLGMRSTYFDLDDAIKAPEHLASGYRWDPDHGNYTEMPYMVVTEVGGAGAIFSNVLDYAKWVKCLLYESAPLSKAVHQDVKTPRFITSPLPGEGFDSVLYGLGWERTSMYGHVVYQHSGGMHAYGAYVYWLPEIKYGVVSFANTAVTSNAAEIILATTLIADRLGIPEEKRFDYAGSERDQLEEEIEWLEHALDNLYPSRPNPPLAPTLNTSQLAGTYYHPGFGHIRLREVINPKNPKEKVLRSDREEASWDHKFTLHHVTGDNWMIRTEMYTTVRDTAFRSQFKIGVDGKTAGLEVEFSDRGAEVAEAVVLFDRLKE
ncbi:beta-lactamase superfamily protein [Metarhizium robertsii]|uniref:Beta-lactamase-type transpeptidase fold domain containing protein n=2 Tax=Metarhizium robertsii TaxID=568076 RepID=E9EST2_METRA|nr:Beta-lactamase-type transpeptidase fold domain containing protein [Metarhizium robertsii ARSEF 23]EFZ01955.1 Beta-lactamase-type transpeptidase fold domain containing protein [Metarhizium robertsii ARSEF 23]EXV02462.1 beta-lactamase superfamily protein [Metarhizium robertsii]